MAIPILSDIGKALSGFFVGKPGGIQYPIGASVTGGGTAEGKPSGFSQLFSNPLFISMLSGAGASLNPRMAGINAMVQKALGGQALGKAASEKGNTFQDLIGQVLSGQMPDNVSVTMDGKGGVSFKAKPTKSSEEGGAPATTNLFGGQGTQATNTQNVDVGYANPFGTGLSNLSAADLAVLGPEGVAQALSYDLNRDQLLASTYNDLLTRRQAERNMDIMENYYGGLLQHYGTADVTDRLNAARAMYEAINKDDRTAMQKEYAQAVTEGYAGKLADWKVLAGDPNTYQEYQKAVEGGYTGSYTDFLLKYKKSDTNINLGPYGTAVEGGRGRGRAQLYDAEGLEKEIMASDRLSNFGLMFDEEDKATYLNEKAKAATEVIYSKVAGEGGRIVGQPTVSGNTITFQIIWSNGDKESYNYVVK